MFYAVPGLILVCAFGYRCFIWRQPTEFVFGSLIQFIPSLIIGKCIHRHAHARTLAHATAHSYTCTHSHKLAMHTHVHTICKSSSIALKTLYYYILASSVSVSVLMFLQVALASSLWRSVLVCRLRPALDARVTTPRYVMCFNYSLF